MYTIAIANQKGGSGKTTTAVNLAAVLAEKGKQVLLIDLDPQAQATTCFGVDVHRVDQTVFAQLLYKEFLGTSIPHLAIPVAANLGLVPSCPLSLEREKELANHPSCVWRLNDALKEVEQKYDYVIIDCPPSMGVLTHAALLASNAVLLAVETSFLALHGVSQLLQLIHTLNNVRNTPLQIHAVATMFDKRTNFARAILKDMRDFFHEKLLNTVIRETTQLKEAASFGKPINVYAKRSKGYDDYLNLAEEVLEKTIGTTQGKQQAMDELTLLAHLYGEGSKTVQMLKAMGISNLSALTNAKPAKISKQGRMPLKAAQRLIQKASRVGDLPLVVTSDTILKAPELVEEFTTFSDTASTESVSFNVASHSTEEETQDQKDIAKMTAEVSPEELHDITDDLYAMLQKH